VYGINLSLYVNQYFKCQMKHMNILTAFPVGELEETIGTPLYYVDEDYPAGPEIQ